MSAHTPGPWSVVCDTPPLARVATPTGKFSIDCTGSGSTHAQSCANAERIVACVNACEGMVAPATEIQALREELERARALLAAR